MSDDGRSRLVLIAFIGSVFSPYYAHARRRAGVRGADPLDHCALNIALYGQGGSRWAMTERGRGRLHRDAQRLQIGPSSLQWDGDRLVIQIDELTSPWPSRIRGTVTMQAARRFDHSVTLAPGHGWCPIAPSARVQVDLGALQWSGPGYLDSNYGDRPLERSFQRWDWSRAQLRGGDSVVFYDVERVAEAPLQLGLRFGTDGRVSTIESPAASALPRTSWQLARRGRGDAGVPLRVRQTLTDAPFYARSLLEAQWLGEDVTVVHESLSLRRFACPVVQAMLPFRMPRRAG